MGLLIIWVSFVIVISVFQELNQLDYFLYSCVILCLLYFYNLVNHTSISLRVVILISSIPNIIFWDVAFVYNDFLSLTSIRYEIFVSLLFIYVYVIIYIFCETVIFKTLEQKSRVLNKN